MARLVQTEKRNKQIGCMSGFLQIFDRQQILAGNRIHSSKRLPPSTGVGESTETVSSVDSREISRELKKAESMKQVAVKPPTSPDICQESPTENINHRGNNSPVVKRYNNEMPRFSLDSERSPSVIARLMGLETFSSPEQQTTKVVMNPELMRSNSESRVSRDLVQSKYIDRNNFQVKVPSLLQKQNVGSVEKNEESNVKLESSRSLFDSTDFYTEKRKEKVVLTKGDIEKKLKMNGLEEHNTDLTTLRQILEVLQLKGLLHSSENRESLRTFVLDRTPPSDNRRFRYDYRVRGSPKPESRKCSPTRIESNLKSCNSIVKRKPLSIEFRRRANESIERISPINSPKLSTKNPGSVHRLVTDRSPRNNKQTESVSVNSRKKRLIKNIVREDESSSISDSMFGTPSTTDSEKSKWDGCKDGKILLQRCDKLLHSIAEMNMINSETESPPSSTTVIPSPVSVLDSGFDKDELSSPSNSIDFKATSAVDCEDDTISIHSVSPKISKSKQEEEAQFISNDPDCLYISKILQASQHISLDSNIFNSLEKQLSNEENTSNVSKRERKLIFDMIIEILDRNKHLPPWKVLNEDSRISLKHIWNEFQKTREINHNVDDGILDLISVVLKKDLIETSGWGDYPIETSEAVLDVERVIFKDLVSEAIGDFVECPGKFVFSKTQRRLVF